MPARKRPADLPHGRWLGDFGELSTLETKLVAACTRGEFCLPDDWDGKRPEEPTDANSVRAEVIRFLALGGDRLHPVHEEGVMVGGAWVAGTLDLHQATAKVRLDLRHCHFDQAISLMSASLPQLALTGSAVPGLHADRIDARGDLFLDAGFSATGEVRLLGARIGKDLACSGGTFANAEGYAFCADGIDVRGSLFLDAGFSATGNVRLPGARIGGDFACSGATFANAAGKALGADDIDVRGGLFLRDAKIIGAVHLPAARIGTLADDERCWAAGQHVLDGLQYDRIIGATDAPARIAWLNRQHSDHLGADFKPQPWEQLIRVLRAMGHPHEASEVAIEKQRMMRQAGVIKGWYRRIPHRIYGLLAGYGYRPIWTVGWMVAAWFVCAAYFGTNEHYFAPTDPLIHFNPSLVERCSVPHSTDSIVAGDFVSKAQWTSPDCPTPAEYTTFNPFAYSLDLILPLVDLQQEGDWAPAVVDPAGRTLWWGAFLRVMMWCEILFGWGTSLMLVAVLGRLVEKD